MYIINQSSLDLWVDIYLVLQFIQAVIKIPSTVFGMHPTFHDVQIDKQIRSTQLLLLLL